MEIGRPDSFRSLAIIDAGGLFIRQIFFDEHLVFTSGYKDPPFTIQACSTQPSKARQLPASSQQSSIHRDPTVLPSTLHGNSSASHYDDQTLLSYSNVDLGQFSVDSIPFSSSSFTALTDSLFDNSDTPLDDSIWNNMSSFGLANQLPLPEAHLQSFGTGIGGDVSPHFISSGEPSNYSITTATGITQDPYSPQMIVQDHQSNSVPPSSSSDEHGSSPEGSSTSIKLSKPKTGSHPGDSSRIEKRKQNTLAARRYRQKRVDQMAGLETTLKETQSERDALKVRVARLEGEVETLRQLLKSRD
ncbi:hypothetical protein P154DRAFT_574268 [Amniculicola lignicola CBS 123094]|uniref:BZIP domain-containing protein n=1 Tax=Amniculicola lignicola CBS 123094 TaxID=1392246 RepID=A0A6A5WK93_9PLEO|nr:hypothetical protein P154DRAFT_574268 [Amniculicola lignicola CBS 123094]